jgi:hypothetical protein
VNGIGIPADRSSRESGLRPHGLRRKILRSVICTNPFAGPVLTAALRRLCTNSSTLNIARERLPPSPFVRRLVRVLLPPLGGMFGLRILRSPFRTVNAHTFGAATANPEYAAQ